MPLPENKVAKEDTAIETGIGGIVQNTFVIDESLNNMTHILEQMVIGIDNLQEMFGEFFEKQKFLLDAQAEKKDAKDVSGGVESDQGKLLEGLSAEDLKMGMFSKIFLGAIVLYATGLDKWIRAIALPSTLKMMNLNFLKPFGKLFTNLMRGFKIGKLKLPTMGLEKNLKGIAKLQLKLGEAVGKAVTNVSNAYRSLTTGLSTRFSSVSKSISKAGGGIKGFAKLGITKVMAGFSKAMAFFMKLLGPFGIAFTQIGKIFLPLNKTMGASGPMKGVMTSISKFAPMFKGVLSTLKFVASKVLLPLFALFDLITGFIEGFKLKGDDDTRGTLERVFDGVVAGIIKAFKGIVIIPLDLIRKGAAWLAEKMGIDWLADALGSFSFEETFDFILKFITNFFSTKPEEGYFSLVKMYVDIFKGIVEGFQVLKNEGPAEFVKWLGEKVKGIIDMIKDFLAGMLDKATFGLFGKDDPEKEKAELEKKIADEQARIERSKAGEDEYLDFESVGQKRSKRKIEAMEKELEELQSKNNDLMLEQNNVNQSSLELNKRTEDVAAQKDENLGGGRGGVIADVGNVTDASTNVNNVSHNYSPGPPSARADMSDNPMMAWKTA